LEKKEYLPYLLVVIDANDACVGRTNGERIEVVWEDSSIVPRKHNKGGQSKNRFQRGREEALKGWLRKVAEVVRREHSDEDIIIGGPGMTKMKFIKEINNNLLIDKIIDVRNTGYTDENGLHELIGKSRYT